MERRFAELESRISESNSYGCRPTGAYESNRYRDSSGYANPNSYHYENSYANSNSNQNSNVNMNQYPSQSSNANSNRNCFRCGDATHQVRDCPLVGMDVRIPSADSRRPPPPQPQRDVRPLRYGSNGPNSVHMDQVQQIQVECLARYR